MNRSTSRRSITILLPLPFARTGIRVRRPRLSRGEPRHDGRTLRWSSYRHEIGIILRQRSPSRCHVVNLLLLKYQQSIQVLANVFTHRRRVVPILGLKLRPEL